jgi:hypothetical protein
MDLNELYNYKIEVTSLKNKNIIDVFNSEKNIILLTNNLYDKLYDNQNTEKRKELYNIIERDIKLWITNIKQEEFNTDKLTYYNNLFIKYILNTYFKNIYQSTINYKINPNYSDITINKYNNTYKNTTGNITFYEKSLYKRNIDKNDGNSLTTSDSKESLQYKPYSTNNFVSYLKF